MHSKLIPSILFLCLCVSPMFGQQLPQKYYENDIDGIIEIKNGQISIDVLDYPHNGKDLSYSLVVDHGMRYLLTNQLKYLVLASDRFIYLFESDRRLLFNGIFGSGRLLEFLVSARTYKASSSLTEKGIEYSANNLSDLIPNKPWAVRGQTRALGKLLKCPGETK